MSDFPLADQVAAILYAGQYDPAGATDQYDELIATHGPEAVANAAEYVQTVISR